MNPISRVEPAAHAMSGRDATRPLRGRHAKLRTHRRDPLTGGSRTGRTSRVRPMPKWSAAGREGSEYRPAGDSRRPG